MHRICMPEVWGHMHSLCLANSLLTSHSYKVDCSDSRKLVSMLCGQCTGYVRPVVRQLFIPHLYTEQSVFRFWQTFYPLASSLTAPAVVMFDLHALLFNNNIMISYSTVSYDFILWCAHSEPVPSQFGQTTSGCSFSVNLK